MPAFTYLASLATPALKYGAEYAGRKILGFTAPAMAAKTARFSVRWMNGTPQQGYLKQFSTFLLSEHAGAKAFNTTKNYMPWVTAAGQIAVEGYNVYQMYQDANENKSEGTQFNWSSFAKAGFIKYGIPLGMQFVLPAAGAFIGAPIAAKLARDGFSCDLINGWFAKPAQPFMKRQCLNIVDFFGKEHAGAKAYNFTQTYLPPAIYFAQKLYHTQSAAANKQQKLEEENNSTAVVSLRASA